MFVPATHARSVSPEAMSRSVFQCHKSSGWVSGLIEPLSVLDDAGSVQHCVSRVLGTQHLVLLVLSWFAPDRTVSTAFPKYGVSPAGYATGVSPDSPRRQCKIAP